MDWKRAVPFLRRNSVADKPWIDREYIEDAYNSSPVPIVAVCILIWTVASVLLLLSENHQRNLTVWSDGQRAPFSIWARNSFTYTDNEATENARNDIRDQEPSVYQIDKEKNRLLKQNMADFFAAVAARSSDTAPEIRDTPANRLALQLKNHRELTAKVRQNSDLLESRLNELFAHGIAGEALLLNNSTSKKVKVITPDGITYELIPPDSDDAARELAALFSLSPSAEKELREALELLLNSGNLIFDQNATDAAIEKALATVKPVVKSCAKGDLIVEREQIITREIVDMLAAEKKSLPTSYGLGLLGQQLLLSLLLLAAALFFLYHIYPKLFRSPARFTAGGFSMILALLANFGAIQLFFYFFSYGILSDYEQMLFMIPIPFGAALTSVLMGNRTALAAGAFAASISALMILPDRSFELALRWFSISAMMTFLVSNVSNYRSFFVRVLFGGFLLTLLINSDVLYSLSGEPEKLPNAVVAAAANSFCCAMAALLAVFAFELIFNANTNMALIVLSDMNHPLLEKLKREAPGTMFHSMTVATLAEDAAKAIKGNPAKAKAGALFHDIGKLTMPQCFVENNIDSTKEYMKMPPQRSCSIIRGHVKEGLRLAREYRLCSFVREAIATHHGDDLISFFYRLAQENNKGENIPVLESQFRYDGEPPVGKELTIISLADACEAASRSLNKPSPAKLESLVNDIFTGRMRGGQLRNSELSTRELNIVRECFIADLISFNHGRIAYQKENNDDSAALPMEEQQTPAPEKK